MADFVDDAGEMGIGAAFAQRSRWGRMRMSPTDIADVTGETYTYLANGHGPVDNWTGLFKTGERVRLRFINASAMTIFQCAYSWSANDRCAVGRFECSAS